MSNNPRYSKAEYDDMAMPNEDMDVSYSWRHSHLVKCRKDTHCCYCGIPIPKGDYALSERGFCDNKPYVVHYCMECVDDEIDVWNHKMDRVDAYLNWEKRYEKYIEGVTCDA